MTQGDAVKVFRSGLLVKLVAMWLLPSGLVLPFIWMSENAMLVAVLIPLVLDLAGRCCCVVLDGGNRWLIRMSILAQVMVIVGLIAFWASVPNGIIFGLLWAVPFQMAAAASFTGHLEQIAKLMGQPDLVEQMQKLRRDVFKASITSHVAFLWTLLLGAVALLIGIMMYGIGLIFTLPMAFLGVLPFWGAAVTFGFIMLFRYEMSLRGFRKALLSYNPGSNELPVESS